MASDKWRFAGIRVKQRRKFLRLDQRGLSKRIGISQTSISAIENDRKIPKASTIALLCDGLKCTPSMFFYPPDEK